MPKGRRRRTTYVFVGRDQRKKIRELSKYVPSLEKYVGKERLTSSEMAAVTRAKKKLRHTSELKPVTAAQAKRLGKDVLAGGGIRAVRLRNTSPHAKVRIGPNGMLIESNGRDFEYHRITPDVDTLIEAGTELLEREHKTPYAIYLWQSHGRMDKGFTKADAWGAYVIGFFQAYQNSEEFILGIVAWVPKKGETRAIK